MLDVIYIAGPLQKDFELQFFGLVNAKWYGEMLKQKKYKHIIPVQLLYALSFKKRLILG